MNVAPAINQLDLDALATLIDCMRALPRFSDLEIETLREPFRRRVAEEMVEHGKTYGEAAGGALSFLTTMSGPSDVRQHDDEFGWHLNVLSRSFTDFLETGEIPAPYYPWRICLMLRKAKLRDLEKSFLSSWEKHFSDRGLGGRYRQLTERLQKMATVSLITFFACAIVNHADAASDNLAAAAAIQDVDLYCPTVTAMEQIGENAIGRSFAITCASSGGAETWRVRAQMLPSGEARFAPWDENPPSWRVRQAPSNFTLKRR